MSTGIVEIAVYEVEDDHQEEDIVLHAFGFRKAYVHYAQHSRMFTKRGKAWCDLTDARRHCKAVGNTQRCPSDVFIDQNNIIEGKSACKA